MFYNPAIIIRKIRDKFRFGLVQLFIRDCLWKIGIQYSSFYWVRESLPDKIPQVRFDKQDDIVFCELDEKCVDDLRRLSKRDPTISNYIQRIYREGHRCCLAKINGRIAGFTCFNLESCEAKTYQAKMKPNEAYLHDLFVIDEFRGRQLAGLLRYKCLELLMSMGRDTVYSLTIICNKSSLRVKEKLGAQVIFKGLYINLFNMWKRNLVLETYDASSG